MPFRCILRSERELRVQESPFCFQTAEECLAFGKAMFDPPQSVVEWKVGKTKGPANYKFKGGSISLL